MIWKELKELALLRSVVARHNPLFLIAVAGIFVPALKAGPMLLGPGIWIYMIMPALSVLSIIGDSFAGERERHTLETLLASRLPDRAIVLGKIVARSYMDG